MEPQRKKTDPKPDTSATIDVEFKGGTTWKHSSAPYMAYDKAGAPPDQVTFSFTDNTGHNYRMVALEFTDKDDKPIPNVMKNWSVDDYDDGLMTKTIADINHNTGDSDLMIKYTVRIMDSNGKKKHTDPKIWDVKGSG